MAASQTNLYPAFLDLRGQAVTVAGGGAVAARKVHGLLRAGARVTVIAPRLGAALRRLAGFRRRRRAFRPGDLAGARLVFAATDDPALNARIAALAELRGLFANVASPPGVGRLLVPASFRRGRLCVAISTGGASAAAAKGLRRELSAQLGAVWGAFLQLLETRRARIRRTVNNPARRRRLLQALGARRWVELLRRRGPRAAGRAMDRLIARARGPARPRQGHLRRRSHGRPARGPIDGGRDARRSPTKMKGAP